MSLITINDDKSSRMNIVFCPHAAGGTGLLKQWRSVFPMAMKFIVALLPGREGHSFDDFPQSIHHWAEHIAVQLANFNEIILFGHSMGSLIAYELAKRLGARVKMLIISDHIPPHKIEKRMNRFKYTDTQLKDFLVACGGVPHEMLDYPEFMELILPALRADLRLCDEYTYQASNKLTIPIVALRGDESSHCSSDAVLGWSELTTNDFMFLTLRGDHFFIYEHSATIMNLLRNNTYYGETYAV